MSEWHFRIFGSHFLCLVSISIRMHTPRIVYTLHGKRLHGIQSVCLLSLCRQMVRVAVADARNAMQHVHANDSPFTFDELSSANSTASGASFTGPSSRAHRDTHNRTAPVPLSAGLALFRQTSDSIEFNKQQQQTDRMKEADFEKRLNFNMFRLVGSSCSGEWNAFGTL